MSEPTKRRGRPPPPRRIEVYTGCFQKVVFRDGARVPCKCASCVDQSKGSAA